MSTERMTKNSRPLLMMRVGDTFKVPYDQVDSLKAAVRYRNNQGKKRLKPKVFALIKDGNGIACIAKRIA